MEQKGASGNPCYPSFQLALEAEAGCGWLDGGKTLLEPWTCPVISGLQNLQPVARTSPALKAVKEAVMFALCVLQLFNVML